MGEARQKAKLEASEWTRLFEPPLQARVVISRPGMRPASTRKYENYLSGWRADTLCFNFNCSSKLSAPPDVYMILLQEKDTQPLIMGVCAQCAQYSNNELVTLVMDQFGKYYGFDRQTPANSAKVALEFPPGVGFNIAGVSFFMPGREAPSIPGGPNVFADLLETGQLHEFMALRPSSLLWRSALRRRSAARHASSHQIMTSSSGSSPASLRSSSGASLVPRRFGNPPPPPPPPIASSSYMLFSSALNPHSPDDALILATRAAIQI
jgi:hypothetical protein